ncbi:heparin-binding EGF-like growth factor b [Neoarius graeffei]|uniref:heparin-binding EGF-like growth factor b n=1 Tax=Neoarius graeffei TaxID=443677 RepID=UPI00298D134B|nr:heparin-binding EGF-like growth factor b [Neoarius graeffei]
MNAFQLGLVFLHCVVFLQLSDCASRDESAVTAGKLVHAPAEVHTPHNDTETDNNEEDISAEYEDKYPRVAFSAKPRANSSLSTSKGHGKSRDGKMNPCLMKAYMNYCINGACQYLPELNRTSCVCETGYSGERCHLFILTVGKGDEGSSHTTALAITAAVLSLMCLTIIAILLALRCKKKGDIGVEEKNSLQPLHSSEQKAKDTNQWLSLHDNYHMETSCQC